jgi:RNA polymerase sigma-70 factor (ECF subfamily)
LDHQDHEEGDFSYAEKLADRRPGPEDLCRERELADLLSHSSTRLTPILRKTLQLREVEGLSIRETAQALGLREGTVKARAARARAGLKKMMQGSVCRDRLPS